MGLVAFICSHNNIVNKQGVRLKADDESVLGGFMCRRLLSGKLKVQLPAILRQCQCR